MSAFSPLPIDCHQTFLLQAQKSCILLVKDTCSWEYFLTLHKRTSGAYWTLTALDLLHALEQTNENEIVSWILSCQQPLGGFGGNTHQDANLLATLSAIQCLALYNQLDKIDKDKVASYIGSLQCADGSFMGDHWGEIDSRFCYAAVLSLSILNRLDIIDTEKTIQFVLSCMNFDGGFGCIPGAESHSGQGVLSLTHSLHLIDQDLVGWWLAERQLKNGGLNGRPDKKADVCYSWWVLASLAMLDRIHWIHVDALVEFIIQCQDLQYGGIADYPGDRCDVFHTFFGLAGLALLGCPVLKPIHPVYALPIDVVERITRMTKK
eukprot:jgi/Galph1/3918/GphlegSOOS_G2631.1